MKTSQARRLLVEENEPRAPRDAEAADLVRRLFGPAVRADPYPLFARIRDLGPVWTDDGVVVFSSYEHCAAVLRSATAVPAATAGGAPGCPWGHGSLLARVGSGAIDGLGSCVRELVDDLLDSVAVRGRRLEVVTDLAYPLPVAVCCRLFGISDVDQVWLRRRLMPLSRTWEPHRALLGAEPPGRADQLRAEAELDRFFGELAARRGTDLGDGLLAPLLSGLPAGARPGADETWALCRSLLVTGQESTADLISNGVLALLRAPHEREGIRRSPDAAGAVVEEVLRTDPPCQVLQRTALDDLDVCGVRVPKGTTVVLLVAAAHRDPRWRHGPDVFDPGSPSDHLGFGLGPHACAGAPLARLLACHALVRFAQRVARPRFATGSPTYRPNVALRGLRALWVDADGFGGRALPWSPGPAHAGTPADPYGGASGGSYAGASADPYDGTSGSGGPPDASPDVPVEGPPGGEFGNAGRRAESYRPPQHDAPL